ncbi:hypothetical protein N0V88_001774 [Collariella sp. IMI 366227]|nr:hypothetical protein N0V88_001774 [Collariella sp. IMI 366227]
MSQQSSFRVLDAYQIEKAMSEDAPTNHASPARATTSGRGRGRGRYARAKNGRVTKPTQQKAATGRGRRQKVYDDPKLQAAHERSQELKQAFSTIVKAVKPAVQEISDRSEVPEYDTITNFLRQRRDDTIEQAARARDYGLQMTRHVYDAEVKKVFETLSTKAAELCEAEYGRILKELDRLEYLYDNNLPADLPPLDDDRYEYKDISQEDADWQGVFYQTQENGVELPYSGKPLSQLMQKPQTQPLDPSKRKADSQPEGQHAPKIAATGKDDEGLPQMPRHPAGLLGASDAIEESAAPTPDSGSARQTPAPEPVEEVPLKRVSQRVASDPDEFGVRLISRRPTRMDIPNNRIVLPNLFEWDDLDIGFRDSTNCAKKGATKARRGNYLGQPGSSYLFVDRRVGIWDSTLAAGELDEELVKKHNLHPRLGLPLPSSTNAWEPPKPIADGWKPVVCVPPKGAAIHASRTIEDARVDADTDEIERRMAFKRAMHEFCNGADIQAEEVGPDAALLEERRAKTLAAHALVTEDTEAFARFAGDILGAAASVEAVEEAPRTAAPKRSRAPYDAIRDVFGDNQPTRQPSPPAAQEALASPDTTNLLALATLTLELATAQVPTTEPAPYNQPQPNGAAVHEQPQAEESRLESVVESARFARQNAAPVHVEPARSHDFLRTALNLRTPPPPQFPAMSHEEYMAAPVRPPTQYAQPPLGMPMQAPQPPAGRTPFSNTGTAKALPALRPMRGLLNEPPAQPEPQPGMHHSGMVPSNTGSYYAPVTSRPYHNGYSLQEPMQPMMQHQPMGNLLQPRSAALPAEETFDYKEAIKDYTPVEPPPRHGPTQIRGWTHNNIRKTAAAITAGRSGGKGKKIVKGGTKMRAREEEDDDQGEQGRGKRVKRGEQTIGSAPATTTAAAVQDGGVATASKTRAREEDNDQGDSNQGREKKRVRWAEPTTSASPPITGYPAISQPRGRLLAPAPPRVQPAPPHYFGHPHGPGLQGVLASPQAFAPLPAPISSSYYDPMLAHRTPAVSMFSVQYGPEWGEGESGAGKSSSMHTSASANITSSEHIASFYNQPPTAYTTSTAHMPAPQQSPLAALEYVSPEDLLPLASAAYRGLHQAREATPVSGGKQGQQQEVIENTPATVSPAQNLSVENLPSQTTPAPAPKSNKLAAKLIKSRARSVARAVPATRSPYNLRRRRGNTPAVSTTATTTSAAAPVTASTTSAAALTAASTAPTTMSTAGLTTTTTPSAAVSTTMAATPSPSTTPAAATSTPPTTLTTPHVNTFTIKDCCIYDVDCPCA